MLIADLLNDVGWVGVVDDGDMANVIAEVLDICVIARQGTNLSSGEL